MPAELTFEQLKERLYKCNPHLTILDKPVKSTDKIRVHCDVCSGTYITTKYNIMANTQYKQERKGCPICAGRLVVKGINDVATTNPETIPYFQNIEDAYKYTRTSTKKVWFVCPDCGCKKFQDIGSFVLLKNKCSICSDGISYPNKFARALLSKLPLDKWCCEYHTPWLGSLSFDNYFEYKGKPYALEMDGRQHKEPILSWDCGDTIAFDARKNKLAKEHGVTLIRIDCFESDRDYIAKNIQKSLLGELFDLSKIDWKECDLIACKSLLIEVCKYYNEVTIDTGEIAKHFDLNRCTVVVYLKKGHELGLCDFTYELARKRVGEKTKRILRDKYLIPVKVYSPSMEYIGDFPNLLDCCDMLNEKHNGIFKGKCVVDMIHRNGGKTHYKGWFFEIIK